MKIVLFSSGFNSYDISIKKALQILGHKVIHYSYRSACYSPRLYKRLLHRMKFKMNNNYETDVWNRKLIELSEKSEPDIVFVLKGEALYPETIGWIKRNTKAKIICWLMDVIKRYSQIERLVPIYDYFFTYEPDDILFLKSLNKKIFYLPLAYDPDIFFKMENVVKKWDLCFIGTSSKSRENFLLAISKLLKKEKFNCIFFLNYYWLFRPNSWGKWFKRNTKYKYFKNHAHFSLEEINLLYNQSKVCLNVHQEFTKNALNIRTFEIFATGRPQLVEKFDSIKLFYNSSKAILTYKTYKEAVSKLKTVLNNSENDYPIGQNHTFESRMKELLKIIGYAS
ncbi:MAG: glycosyltransferase [Candidatus Cloacimonetes bacterium]|nr:glycosyltransferase [Candidatus Cloacimonadota bacterium]